MIDLSFIGKEGIIMQYDDIISMIGFNVARYLKSKNIDNAKLSEMSTEDILLSYINRPHEDPSVWLKDTFDIEFDINRYLDSEIMWQPNWLYSYKVFKAAYENGIKNIFVYSSIHSPAVERYLETYKMPVGYITGDITNILPKRMNYTFMTASPSNIRKCLKLDVPLAITIVDDFMPIADIVIDNVADELRKRDKFVNFTGIVASGLI